ncbi:MAG: CvpA family protein [Clostridia bacterium]|nr:CvpA family protein [Clostridia bacterium]
MGIMNLAIIAVFALFVLAGVYKGFLWNLAALGASVLSLLIAFIFMGSVSRLIANNQGIYSAMLSYTEGREDIYNVDLVDRDITTLTNAEIDEIMERSNLPFPFRDRVRDNIMSEALKSRGVTTLGEYFNQSKVMVFVNIVSFILIYLISRILLTVLISWADYSYRFPKLRIPLTDQIAGGAVGFIRGLIDVSVVFMVTPVVLTVLPFDQIEELISGSTLATFLYNSNLILRLIPGVL